jgi:chromosome segregation protein
MLFLMVQILRKPSGQCSIELLFDNSMGKLGGEYAKYNEISIKE